MRRWMKFVVAGLAGATIAGGVAAPAAEAAPRASATKPIPNVAVWGYEFFTYGNNANCRGNVRVSVSAPKNKRGVVRYTLTSKGFTGDGKAWKRKPKCDLLFLVNELSTTAYNQETFISGSLGKRGDSVYKDIFTGSGPAQMSVWTMQRGTLVRIPQSFGTGVQMIVP